MTTRESVLGIVRGTRPGSVEKIGQDWVMKDGFDRLVVTKTVKALVSEGSVRDCDGKLEPVGGRDGVV